MSVQSFWYLPYKRSKFWITIGNKFSMFLNIAHLNFFITKFVLSGVENQARTYEVCVNRTEDQEVNIWSNDSRKSFDGSIGGSLFSERFRTNHVVPWEECWSTNEPTNIQNSFYYNTIFRSVCLENLILVPGKVFFCRF